MGYLDRPERVNQLLLDFLAWPGLDLARSGLDDHLDVADVERLGALLPGPPLLEVHEGVPWAAEQTVPQPPQCAVSLVVSTSQPLAALPSQSSKPCTHPAEVHEPFWQAYV